jgi:hypothetical protein
MLRPEWARTAEFDVFHLHFGLNACSPEDLADLGTVLKERGKPLVFTVQYLRNPHYETSDVHDAQLDVLIPLADRLITLTPGAAAEIRRRWGHRQPALAASFSATPSSTRQHPRPGRPVVDLSGCVRRLPYGYLT